MDQDAYALLKRAETAVNDAGHRALAAAECLPGPVPEFVAWTWASEVGAVLTYLQRALEAAPADQRDEFGVYCSGMWEIADFWREILDGAECATGAPDWDAELRKIS